MQEHLELFKNVHMTMTILIEEPQIYLTKLEYKGT